MRINHLVCDADEFPERAIESGVVDAAAGDEQWCDGRWRIERQRSLIPQLVQSLRAVGGPDDVVSGALRLAKFKRQRAARSTEVGRVTRQSPVQMEQAGEAGDIDVG